MIILSILSLMVHYNQYIGKTFFDSDTKRYLADTR